MRWAVLVLVAVISGCAGAVETAAPGRDPQQVVLFRRDHPCPATGRTDGACPGWVVDHRWPLCAGGKDAPDNMAWQMTASSYDKDRVERALCACLGGHK